MQHLACKLKQFIQALGFNHCINEDGYIRRNMTHNNRKGIRLDYNCLNLLMQIAAA